jgi:hypothetical protein
MWYEILTENEFAEYFINTDPTLQDEEEKQKADEMLDGLRKIVRGVSTAWAHYYSPRKDVLRQGLKYYSQFAVNSFDFCYRQIHLSKAINLPEIWHSISNNQGESKYSIELSQLTAEQCAILIIYQFWGRMGVSTLKYFYESGGLKKYLTALKNKSLNP